MRRMHFLLLMLAGASVPAALGHPSYFHDRNIAHTCTEHPTRPAGNHISPINDQDITVKASQHGQFLKEVCPGETYKLTVSFGEQERAALVTVSGGTLQEANVAGCTNAVTTKGNEMVTTMNAHWEVPCSLLGRVEVKVTTATGFTGPWLKGSSGFTILPVSKCPGYNKCKADSLNPPAARSHAASPTTDFPSKPKINETALGSNPDGEQDAAAGPLFFAVNQPVSLGGSLPNGLARGGRMCAPSSLGYQCSVNVAAGVNVHYSYGGPAPLNACTNKTTVERVARNASSLMHYAIETEQEAHSFRLTAQQAGGIKPAPGWAHGLGGVVRPKAGSKGSGVMTVCFSRPAVAKASMVPNLDPSMVPLIWSSHSKGHFVDRHDKDGSLIVNMLSGQHAVLNKHDSTAVKTNYVMHIAHASAMIAAFAVLMPLAGLVARHRWIFTPANEPYNSKAGGAWFPIHLFVQLLGCVAAIVSYVLAMLQWFGKHSLGFDRHLLYAPHCELGTGVMAMVGVQLLVGGLRFCMPPRWRSSWKMMHGLWGWATVGAGGGGIKPCVSSFGGDQFKETSARERSWRSSFFNYFYFVINIGALVASTVVVGVQEVKGYGVGFGIPTAAFMAAISLFVAGAVANLYTRVPPEGSPFRRIFRVFRAAFAKRHMVLPADPSDLYEPAGGADDGHGVPFKMVHTARMRGLDKAAIAVPSAESPRSKLPNGTGLSKRVSSSSSSKQHSSSSSRARVSVSEVEETKAFLGIMPLFLCICIYQMAGDPISTLLPYTGDAMDRRLNSHTEVPASSVSFTNTFGVLGMVVLYDLVIAPLAARWLGRPISMTMRIGLGFAIQIVALMSAGFIELMRYKRIRSSGVLAAFEAAGPGADPLDPQFTQPMSIWWQAIPYFLSGASEVFANIGCMELFYTNVSEGMRSLGTSVYLLSISVGMYLAGGLNMAIAAAAPKDPWLANNTLYGHYDMYFFLNAGILVLGTIAYVLIARNYTEKPVAPSRGALAKGAAGDDEFKAA